MNTTAFGAPGVPPTWSSSDKDFITTALGPSRLWATVGHGIINEVYWPSTGSPQIRDDSFYLVGNTSRIDLKRVQRYLLATLLGISYPFVQKLGSTVLEKSLAKSRRAANSSFLKMIVRRCRRGRLYAKRTVIAATWLLLSSCHSSSHLSFLDPQGPVAEIQRLHFLEMLALLAIFVAVPVFLVTPWFAWRYRYRASPRHEPKWKFYTPLDIACWAGPVVIVTLLGALLWSSTHALDPYKPLASNQPALRIQVIGYDWKWLFIYPDEGVASIGELALPAGRPVAMQLTSATVMQSLQIPALGSQIYAMGGMVTQLHLEATKPGRFMGENTMYNGNGFHQQKFTAVAMTPDEFQAWVQKVRASSVRMDEATLNAISKRTTRAELIAAVGSAKSTDGNVYFSGVTATLFPAVVKAPMDGTAIRPADIGEEAAAVSVIRKPVKPVTEKRQ